MLRKGRCSNDPGLCQLAERKTELPYAGIDSVCPECGSPLAAIAAPVGAALSGQSQNQEPKQLDPINISSPAAQVSPPQRAARVETPFDEVPTRYQERDDEEPLPSGSSAMKFTQMAIVGAALALIAFFAWRMFLQPRPVSAPELAAAGNVTGVAGQQVTQISPAQIRSVSMATQAHSTPDASGPIVGQLPVGTVLDVSGSINVNGTKWLRITLPNDSSKAGFVQESFLGAMGEGGLEVTPVNPGPTDGVPGLLPPTNGIAAVPPNVPLVIGPIQSREPATLYVASRQANVRQEADVKSSKLGTFEFTDAITIIGERRVGAGTWYQVQLPSGGVGWINARLVSTTPRDIPLDNATASPPEQAAVPKAKPESTPDEPDAVPKSVLTAVGPGTTMRVESDVANLRKEPGTTGKSVLEVLQRDTLMSVEDVRILDGVPWYRVTSPNGAQGWVSGRTVVENK